MNRESPCINESNIAVLNRPHHEATTTEYNDDDISHMIYEIRGQQVMLDFDLAALYGYEVKKLNQQVKRNIERFPHDFMFQLTESEMIELSSVLRGPIAVKQSIHIMRVFVKMRHYITQNKPLLNYKDLLMIPCKTRTI